MSSRVGRPALAIGAVALAGLIAMPALAQELSPSPSDEPSASAAASTSASPEASASAEVSASADATASTSVEPSATSVPSAVTPSATTAPAPAATGAPSPAAAGDEDKADESDEADTPPISLTGIVGVDTSEKHPHYTLTVGSVVYELETGPWWFWGADHPLAPFVGHATTILGAAEGEHGIEVFKANGTTIREPGKPPWAGGPKVVGEKHPGWKPWMADGKPGKGPKTPDDATP
jgi:hypothetical protein